MKNLEKLTLHYQQGASLGSMVGFLTYGNKKFYELDSKMRELIPPLYKAMKDLMQFVDADAAAYSEYMVSGGKSFCYDSDSKQQFYIFPYLDFKIIFCIILFLIRFSSSS